MFYALIVVGFIICALMAIRAKRLLISAVWLAATSALVALLLYLLGALQIAVIELSVGAGLVTVLFVFAIGIAGEDELDLQAIVPRPLAIGLVAVSLFLLLLMNLPLLGVNIPVVGASSTTFSATLWQQRGADVLVQVVLLFAGVVGVLGLLGEARGEARMKQVQSTAASGQEGQA